MPGKRTSKRCAILPTYVNLKYSLQFNKENYHVREHKEKGKLLMANSKGLYAGTE